MWTLNTRFTLGYPSLIRRKKANMQLCITHSSLVRRADAFELLTQDKFISNNIIAIKYIKIRKACIYDIIKSFI